MVTESILFFLCRSSPSLDSLPAPAMLSGGQRLSGPLTGPDAKMRDVWGGSGSECRASDGVGSLAVALPLPETTL